MITTRWGRTVTGVLSAFVVIGLLAATVIWWVFRDVGATRLTAYFAETVGVYPGSDVRILGVPVGTVDAVVPEGTQVAVRMTVDHGVSVPAGAQAVVVAPSVVSDRYVQLTPVYQGGTRLTDGAVIPADRTATPVELDQLYASLDRLATALGPNGANANGALSDLLNTGAADLAGNGQALGDTIGRLGAAARTLSGSADDLFATIDNLRRFTAMLTSNDGQVRLATQQLSQVSGFLAADRDDLAAALNELASALGQVQGFIADNRSQISSNVDKLAAITRILVNQRASLAEALDVAPLAVTNLLNTYDPATGTLTGRADLNEFSMTVSSGAKSPILPLTPIGGN